MFRDHETEIRGLRIALIQIKGKADLACDVLGPDAISFRSWGMISEMAGAALDGTPHPQLPTLGTQGVE